MHAPIVDWTRMQKKNVEKFERASHLVRGLDVVEPRLFVSGNLVNVHAVDEALHARVKDHNLLIGNQKRRWHKKTVTYIRIV